MPASKIFPQLTTERLVLRKMTVSDKHDIFHMQSDPQMSEHSDSRPETEIDGTLEYIERMNLGELEGKWILWAIEEKASKKVIGTVSIWNFSKDKKIAELGYGIVPSAQGKGLMSEALKAVVDYCFKTLGMDFLDAYTEENNHPSIKLLTRCGFTEVDRVTDEGFYSKRDFIMIVFRLDNHLND